MLVSTAISAYSLRKALAVQVQTPIDIGQHKLFRGDSYEQ